MPTPGLLRHKKVHFILAMCGKVWNLVLVKGQVLHKLAWLPAPACLAGGTKSQQRRESLQTSINCS